MAPNTNHNPPTGSRRSKGETNINKKELEQEQKKKEILLGCLGKDLVLFGNTAVGVGKDVDVAVAAAASDLSSQ